MFSFFPLFSFLQEGRERTVQKVTLCDSSYFISRPEHLPISDNNVTTTNDHLEAGDWDNESDIDVSISIYLILFIYLSIYLFIYSHNCLVIYLFISICISIHKTFLLSIYLSTNLWIYI